MVQINFAQKQINAKVVYYGPGMSGKTTNLEVVHKRAPDDNRGELTSISTDGDRTLFFDYMPLDLGTIAGMKTSFQMYTVPGQVYYNSTRKLVLQGVDGIIFVADSSPGAMEANLESLRNLEENLNEYGKSLATLPHVVQFNKRDIPGAMSMSEMQEQLNPHDVPAFEAVAATGQGVFPTLKGLASLVLKHIQQECGGGRPGAGPAPAVTPAATSTSAPTEAPAPVAANSDVSAVPAPTPSSGEGRTETRRPLETAAPMSLRTTNEAPPARPAPAAAPAAVAQTATEETYAPSGSSAAQLMRQRATTRRPQANTAAATTAAPNPTVRRRPAPRRAPERAPAAQPSALKGNLFVVAAAILGAGAAAAILKFI
ncbi:Mutual gliding-motility protein MglA [Planctomycetes bacterium Pla163]|uniref:Mutual gliding-motility protein MglA n=1 Tax=Rohdeia mirabilis TaxID=2528008 RepID=A0A518CZ03_9BACT|nr:Mutual gliding-motility protein MglA [Planctomycetes bacterium Pla163]